MQKEPRKKSKQFYQYTCAVLTVWNQNTKYRVCPRSGMLALTDIVARISSHTTACSLDSQERPRNESSLATAFVVIGSQTPVPFSMALSEEIEA